MYSSQTKDIGETSSQGDINQAQFENNNETEATSSHYSIKLEEENDSLILDEEPSFPSHSYICDNGDFLHLFSSNNPIKTKSIHCYSPWIIKCNDDASLIANIEVEDDEKGFTLAICGSSEIIMGTFLHYFASGQTMHPMETQAVRRLCICPMHRRAVLISLLDDLILSCVQLPSEEFCRLRNLEWKKKQQSQEQSQENNNNNNKLFQLTEEESGEAWRVVVEHKGRGFVRFYGVERRKNFCFCDVPLSYIS